VNFGNISPISYLIHFPVDLGGFPIPKIMFQILLEYSLIFLGIFHQNVSHYLKMNVQHYSAVYSSDQGMQVEGRGVLAMAGRKEVCGRRQKAA